MLPVGDADNDAVGTWLGDPSDDSDGKWIPRIDAVEETDDTTVAVPVFASAEYEITDDTDRQVQPQTDASIYARGYVPDYAEPEDASGTAALPTPTGASYAIVDPDPAELLDYPDPTEVTDYDDLNDAVTSTAAPIQVGGSTDSRASAPLVDEVANPVDQASLPAGDDSPVDADSSGSGDLDTRSQVTQEINTAATDQGLSHNSRSADPATSPRTTDPDQGRADINMSEDPLYVGGDDVLADLGLAADDAEVAGSLGSTFASDETPDSNEPSHAHEDEDDDGGLAGLFTNESDNDDDNDDDIDPATGVADGLAGLFDNDEEDVEQSGGS